ncbi:aminoglycoside phosphotransferase family protein [Armatimonas sp.]|uniref:aminoglycoside phosphotransferase family protein n=1 Tax=Armatimonas sp. TaxID=1872638 RepID=UPI00286C7CB6|nr:aminoglycoside phosphotransferase family protein [Armatimonas sp.]
MVRAEAIAREFFGQGATSVEALLGLGSVNEIFVAQFPKNRIIIRLPKPEDQHRAGAFYEKELWCLEQATLLKIPSPLVLKLSTHDGWPYQIQSFVEGVNGEQSALSPTVLWQTLGEYARRFHKCHLSGFGDSASIFSFTNTREEPTSLDIFCPTPAQRGWQRFLRYNLASLTDDDPLLALGVYAPSQRDVIHAHFSELYLREFRFGLCHGDLAPRNTIVASDGTLFLLDWGCAESHLVPHYDLLNVPTEHQDAFLDGYGWPITARATLLAEVKNLALLKSFDLVRWAIDRCPERIEELAEKARKQVKVSV